MKTTIERFLFFILFLSGTGFADFFEYNLNGQLTAIIDPIGRKTSLEYDSVGRLAKIIYSNGKTVCYRYDANDNRTEMEDEQGITRFTYDNLDRLIAVSYPRLDRLTYVYNSANQIISMKYPSGEEVAYRYDDSGRLDAVSHQEGILKYIYEPSSHLPSKIIYPNGICTEYSYDAAKQVTAVIHKDAAGSLILSYHYQYDPNQNCILKEENSKKGKRTARYSYDKLDRLVEANYSDGTFEKYTYDGFSNRTAKETEKGIETYLYDGNNRLIQKGHFHFYYNDLGNLIKKEDGKQVIEYFYDENNFLVEVKSPKHHVTFVYDGEGKRIYKIVDGVKTRYINDASLVTQVLMEMDANNELKTHYFYV